MLSADFAILCSELKREEQLASVPNRKQVAYSWATVLYSFPLTTAFFSLLSPRHFPPRTSNHPRILLPTSTSPPGLVRVTSSSHSLHISVGKNLHKNQGCSQQSQCLIRRDLSLLKKKKQCITQILSFQCKVCSHQDNTRKNITWKIC